MDASPIAHTLNCTQCGGELHPDEGQIFLTCPFCQSTVFLDKSQVVFHWVLAPTLDEEKARGSLFRWMASNQTVKDLDKKSRLSGISFQYFPVWYFKRRTAGGQETIFLEPASATAVTELKNLKLPAGDLRRYDTALDAQSLPPSVPLQAALGWLEQRQVPFSEVAERAVVHIPLYTCKYDFKGRSYTAVVEGATGEVFANIFPAKAEAPYLAVAMAAALVYLCLATFPVIGAMAGGGDALMLGLLACGGLGLLSAPALFVAAAWVAAKV